MTDVARTVARGSLARLVTLPIGAAAAAVNVYLLIGYAGRERFGYIAMVGALFQLIPFADLGLGASVMDAVSNRHESPRMVRPILRRATIVLLTLGVGLTLVTLAIAAVGGWSKLLGVPAYYGRGPGVAVAAALGIYFLSLPLGLGQRILAGLSLSHLLQYLAAVGPVTSALFTALGVWIGIPAFMLAIGAPLGAAVSAALCAIIGLRRLRFGWLELMVPPQDSKFRVSLRRTALPFLIISAGIAVAMQSDRIVLSHFSTPGELAAHAIGVQVYAPVLSVVTAGTIALWPAFASTAVDALGLWRQSLKYTGIAGAGLGILMLCTLPVISGVLSHGQISIGPFLSGAFGILVLVMALHQPSAMLLTDAKGLKFQAFCVVGMVLINLPLSIFLSVLWGAPGPVIASALSVVLAQLLPGIVSARKQLRTGVAV